MRGVRKDDGFTLVEVMVALAVLGTFMAAAGPFFVSSIRVMSRQSASQAAVQLADSALEQVHSVRGSSLASGRSQAMSDKQWNDAPPRLRKAYQNYMQVYGDIQDPSSTVGADAPIPTSTQSMKVEQTTYQRSIFVGICDINLEVSRTTA
jgi:prepilin-type N-terminal cleavage/methylation domain-containing protein